MPESRKAVDGMVPPSLGIYDEEETQSVKLGTRVEFDDGSVFRYVHDDGTGIAVGMLVQYGGTVKDIDASDPVISVTNYDGTSSEYPWIEFTSGSTDLTAHAYDNGFFVVDSGTGAAQRRKIRENTASIVKLYDPLITAVTASSHGHLIPNPYEDVKLSTASGSSVGLILGVTVRAITAGYYAWIQTRGWAVVQDTATPAQGIPLIQGTTAGKTLELAEDTFGQVIAVPPYTSGTNGDAMLVYLKCE